MAEFSEVITDQSKRLGHVDGLAKRLLHVLGHEHRVHLALPEAGKTSAGGSTWATARPFRAPRCGTSISQHELIGSYEDRSDPSLYVRLPLLDDDGDALVV